MKKFITFNNFIFLVAFVMFFLQFAPFVGLQIFMHGENTNVFYNLFKFTFGGEISLPDVAKEQITYTLLPSTGLIIAFVFEIVGLLLLLSKNKIKLGSLLAAPFLITAGILLCLTVTFVRDASIGKTVTQMGSLLIFPTGVKFAVSIMFIILGCFAVIDAISTFAKPKVQQVY